MTEYDVHFSINGFYKITASSEEEADEIAEAMLKELEPEVEKVLHTGIGFELHETLESGIQYEEDDQPTFYVYYDDAGGNPYRSDDTHDEDAANRLAFDLEQQGFINIGVVSKEQADALGPDTGEEVGT